VDPVSVWIIKQLADSASERARLKLSNFIFGDQLQRALRNPTEIALAAAVDAVLGEAASPEARQRAFDIMGMFWTPELKIAGVGNTITGSLQGIVARAIDLANAPVKGLPEEYVTTTTLTSLSDELGIRIDGDEFAAAFVGAWLDAVRDGSLSNEVLHPLADLLAHERTQAQAAHNHAATQAAILGSEERLSETLRAAIQSLYEQALRSGGATMERRLLWFEIHVEPADKLMIEIHDDYRSGFNFTLDALRSAGDLENAMRRLKAVRERKITGRRRVVIIARELLKERPEGVFGASLDAPFVKYLEAVEGFQRSDAGLDETWYRAYIDKFNLLMEWGDNPHLRSNYSEIAEVQDLKGQFAHAIDHVLNTELPKKWDQYEEARVRLRNACLKDPIL
jgi:hypothetical protein